MITRGGFLKLGAAAAASLTLHPTDRFWLQPDDEPTPMAGKARVAASYVYRYSQPDLSSERLGTLRRNTLVNILEEIISPHGPSHNPHWYRLDKGYAYSGWLQRVDGAHLHREPLENLPEDGRLGRICLPFTQSLRKLRHDWQGLYHLYYQSVHWITGLETGPDDTLWYRLTDDLLHAHHYVPARHVHPVDDQELSPISPDVKPEDKRVYLSIEDQSLTAYEADQPVLTVKVSTGIPTDPIPGLLPTETPRGRFYIQTKMPSRYMGDGNLTDDIEAYELPGVPWVCFFQKDGYGFHGTYWHDNFGRMMSHGCVNMRNEDALWLYRWSTPIASPKDWYVRELGTRVDIE